jgi:O-antigen/teichoic acid export membrane protein
VVLLQGAATYLLLTAGYGVVPLVAATASINILSYAAYAMAARRAFPQMQIAVRRFSPSRVREVTAFSMYLFLIGIAAQVGMHVHTPILGAYLGTSAIAVYAVAYRLAEYQRQLCGQFSGFLFPLIVRYHAQNDATALRGTLVEGTRIGLGLATLAALGLIVFGDELIRIWMGRGFEAAVVPLYVLAIAGIVMVAQGPTGTILLGTGRHRLVAGASISESALNVGTMIALIGWLGLPGVAIGTAVPYIILNVFLLIPAACRAVDIPLSRFVRSAVVPTVVAVIPAAAVGILLRRAAPPESIVLLLGEGALVALVFATAFWTLGLSGEERGRYRISVRELAAGSVPAPTVAAS